MSGWGQTTEDSHPINSVSAGQCGSPNSGTDRTGHPHLHSPSRTVFGRYLLFIAAIAKPGFAGMGHGPPLKGITGPGNWELPQTSSLRRVRQMSPFPSNIENTPLAPESSLPAVPRNWNKGTRVSIQSLNTDLAAQSQSHLQQNSRLRAPT